MASITRHLVVIGATLVVCYAAAAASQDQEKPARTKSPSTERQNQSPQGEKRPEPQQAEDAGRSSAAISMWKDDNRRIFAQAVALGKPKVIIVPPLVPEKAHAVDVSARILIGRRLAQIIEPDSGPIPDPGLVFRAFGEPRSLNSSDMRMLAEHASAEYLITGTASHDGAGTMTVILRKTPVRARGQELVFEARDIAVSDSTPPELAFDRVVQDAARALGFKAGERTQAKAISAGALPLPPTLLPASTVGTLEGIWLQQLIGALHLQIEYASLRARERVFERTLAALLAIDRGSPDYRVLMSRSLAYLDRRVAALQALPSGAGTPEEVALKAYLVADLPALKAATGQITRPIPRLISELELLDLRNEFGELPDVERKAAVAQLTAAVPQAWQLLIAFRLSAFNLWDLPSPAYVKTLLDHDFPIEGFRAEDIARGMAALGATAVDERLNLELALSPMLHAQRWRAANKQALCCTARATSWSGLERNQYLDLLESIADSLIVGRLAFLRHAQGLPDQMKHLADMLDERLFAGGHPGIIAQRMFALSAPSPKATSPRSSGPPRAELFELASRILALEPVQSGASAFALHAWIRAQHENKSDRMMRKLGPGPKIEHHAQVFDFPRRWRWADIAHNINIADPNDADFKLALVRDNQFNLGLARDACILTIARFRACSRYVANLKEFAPKEEYERAVKAHVEQRFKGNTQRTLYLVQARREAGDAGGARGLLTEAVASGHASIDVYSALGNLLRDDGEYSAAANAYLSYPQLKDRHDNVVRLSNYLGSAAYGLVMRGAAEAARPLLALAADNKDGSANSLWASAQLALIDGDFHKAIPHYQHLYQRYQQPATVRQLSSLLFALGEPQAAWAALRQGIPASRIFSPYRGAVVGMRATGGTLDGTVAWANETLATVDPRIAEEFVMNVMFQSLASDRRPASIKSFVEAASRLRAPGSPEAIYALSINKDLESRFPYATIRTRVLVAYGEGYAAFKARDYAQVMTTFERLVEHCEQNNVLPFFSGALDSFWAAMPYVALSMAKVGKIGDAKALPERWLSVTTPRIAGETVKRTRPGSIPEFDRLLAYAAAEAFAGNHSGAERLARQAQSRIAEPDTRLISPEYAFVEILESLAYETKHAAYLQIALDFARGFQRYEPWTGWAYAFEAKHGPAGPQRVRAAALAIALDVQSERLSSLNASVLAEAKAWLKNNNPLAPKNIKQQTGI